jgi:signal transduction histidine kinase
MTTVQLKAAIERRTRHLQVANTELLRAVERAEEATRHKSAFLANMSHELRTPLSSIIGFAELLQSVVFGPLTEKQTHFVENILRSGQHLLTLINDLLDLSKIEAGMLAIQPELFPLREALEATVHIVGPQADRKCQSIDLTVEDGLSWIQADPTRFKQILYNLLSNAIKFTPEGGRIMVAARRVLSSGFRVSSSGPKTQNPKPETVGTGEGVEIAVADTGIGIKTEALSRLFQRFSQLEAPIVKRHQGTGLGLVLTKCLVELHGGSIQAHSDGEGHGSTFTVRLPQH